MSVCRTGGRTNVKKDKRMDNISTLRVQLEEIRIREREGCSSVEYDWSMRMRLYRGKREIQYGASFVFVRMKYAKRIKG